MATSDGGDKNNASAGRPTTFAERRATVRTAARPVTSADIAREVYEEIIGRHAMTGYRGVNLEMIRQCMDVALENLGVINFIVDLDARP